MTIFKHVAEGPGPAGDIWTTSMHSQSSQDIAAVHTAWSTAAEGFYETVMGLKWSPETQCTRIATIALEPVTGRQAAIRDTAVSWVGVDTGQALPQRVATVISLRTDLPTKAGRGRFYVPAPASTFLDETGEMTDQAAQDLADGAAAMIRNLAATATACVYHQAQGTYTQITRVLVSPVFGTQRRRSNKLSPRYQSTTV